MALPLVLVPEERQRLHQVITRCLAGESNTQLLEEAVRKGDKTTVLALLRLGMDKDTRCPSGSTPLILAAGYGHPAVVNALLKAGADVHLGDGHGSTALHEAADWGHKGIVIALLRAKADKDARTGDNETPLYLAANQDHLPVVEVLMAAGADLNVRATGYATALEVAIMNRNNHVVAAILDHGADVNAQGPGGEGGVMHSALGYAWDGKVVDILVRAGANVNLQTNEGETPLMRAAGRCNVEGLLILLQHGAKVNVKDSDEGTPLHYLCQFFKAVCDINDKKGPGRGRKQAAATTSLLLRWGADEAALDNDGKTPADLLPQEGADDVRLLLTRAPVDRAWRRRGWLVILRDRGFKEKVRAAQRRRSDEDEGNVHLVMVVHKLLGVREDTVFRTVVSYL